MTPEEKASELIVIVKSYVASALKPLQDKIVDLEKRLSEIPEYKNGIDGKDGKDGVNGLSPDPEEIDKLVNSAVAKVMARIRKPKDGKDGRDGRDGRDGIDGKDALDIDILPLINEEKSYAKGTYAMHNGGLMRAVRKTETLDDWETVIDGVTSIKFTNEGRDFTGVVTKTSGKKEHVKFNLPAMMYQGVYKQSNEYQPGDIVTWAGSLWHCEEATKNKPGESKEWVLAVKRGRDGKNGVDGARGMQGEHGKAGRDLTQMDTNGAKW